MQNSKLKTYAIKAIKLADDILAVEQNAAAKKLPKESSAIADYRKAHLQNKNIKNAADSNLFDYIENCIKVLEDIDIGDYAKIVHAVHALWNAKIALKAKIILAKSKYSSKHRKDLRDLVWGCSEGMRDESRSNNTFNSGSRKELSILKIKNAGQAAEIGAFIAKEIVVKDLSKAA